jgi:hypothetical protein
MIVRQAYQERSTPERPDHSADPQPTQPQPARTKTTATATKAKRGKVNKEAG